MTRTLWRASLRYTLRHPWQFGLSLLGVALGVAVVVAIDLTIDSARQAFRHSADTVLGRTTHQVVGGPAGIAEQVFVRMRREFASVPAAPIVEGRARVEKRDGEHVVLLGVDPVSERDFRAYAAVAGARERPDMARLMTEPGAMLASSSTVRRLGLARGAAIELIGGGRAVELNHLGALSTGGAIGEAALDGVLLVDIATAQEALGLLGRLSRIDLVLPGGRVGDALHERLRAWLPPGTRLISAKARSGAMQQMTGAFELNLRMLSLLALVVGTFLIYNAMTFSVVQRRALFGGLRTLGASRAQVFALVLGEAVVVAGAACALGLVLGALLAEQLLAMVTRTINDLYFHVTVRSVHLSPLVLAKGLALGVAAALLAAFVPALEATRVPPGQALARSGVEDRARAVAMPAAIAGVGLIGASALLLVLPGEGVGAGFAALFGMAGGFALLAPVVTIAALGALLAVASPVSGSLLRMSARGVMGNLSRTVIAIAALMVALSASIGVGVMVDSFRRAVVEWLDVTLRADIYVGVPGSGSGGTLGVDLVRRINSIDGVAELSAGRRVVVETPGAPIEMLVLRMAKGSYGGFRLIAGEPRIAWPAFDSAGAVLVSEPLAYRRGLAVGGAIALLTMRGIRDFPVAGVYRDYGSDQGAVLMSRATYAAHWDDAGVSAVGLYLEPSADPGAVRRAGAAAASSCWRRAASPVTESSLTVISSGATARTCWWPAPMQVRRASWRSRSVCQATCRRDRSTRPESSRISGCCGTPAPTGTACRSRTDR